MTKKTFILIAITSCVSIAAQFSASAAIIPAGTNLTVRTVDTISSQDRVGKKFLARNAVRRCGYSNECHLLWSEHGSDMKVSASSRLIGNLDVCLIFAGSESLQIPWPS